MGEMHQMRTYFHSLLKKYSEFSHLVKRSEFSTLLSLGQ